MDIEKALPVQKLIEEIIEKMGFSAQVVLREAFLPIHGDFLCNIRVDTDSNLLIGQKGVNLQALQHLTRLLVRKKLDYEGYFTLDVNSYWEDKGRSLVHEAEEAANKAISERTAVLLRSMTNVERKIVHTALAERKDVATESLGQGEDRKVAVKPASDI